MAKRKKSVAGYNDPHAGLLEAIQERRRRRLFFPRLLEDAADDQRLATPQRDAAYEVIRKWWGLARSGDLNRKETSIDDAFLAEVFGQALGYRGVTESPTTYERERQFYVPNVGPCDGALGEFPPAHPDNVRAVIELKAAQTHLDRDRSSGRTAAQQVWDYLNAMPPSCIWGIVSNFATIRLYHRTQGSQAYEQFSLRELAEDRQAFNRFHAVFHLGGLLRGVLGQAALAVRLLETTGEQQRRVGDDLYKYYSDNRLRLVEHLHRDKGLDLETAIRVAQKLIDRVLFIAFCEDRGLIVGKAIQKACQQVPAFSKARNPIWQNFVGLFHAMDKGSPAIEAENGYNGGLFREDELIDSLDLDDNPWTTFFQGIANFDYAHEVNVDVLGHLFEKSVTELERLREGGFFAEDRTRVEAPMMPKSPQRKLFGIYYTPVELTSAIVEYTVDELVAERFKAAQHSYGLADEQLTNGADPLATLAYWRECYAILERLKVCDPACGSGAFLIQAYESLLGHYARVITELENLGEADAVRLSDRLPETILSRNLYGVDLQPEAVEIAQLSLWLRTARHGKTLADLSANIVCGNSLVDDSAVHPRAMKWAEAFPQIFAGDEPGFDCVIGNPPWERLKLQEREFFALSAPRIASTVNAADRRKRIKALESDNPELYAKYQEAKAEADRTLTYARMSGRYPLTRNGDINTYVLFAELATQLVAPRGRVGLLVPSGIASDKTTARFFDMLMSTGRLRRLYDFENRRHIFEDVDGRFKFSILNVAGPEAGGESADFVFFAHGIRELEDARRHVALSPDDMALMNPNTRTCPVFRDARSAEITRAVYRRVRVLIDRSRKEGGNPWAVRFIRMFDQTNDAQLFATEASLKKKRYRVEGNRWVKGRKTFLPLYEAKMIQAYDHRAGSIEVVDANWMRQGQTLEPSLVEYENPEHVAMPRWWVDRAVVQHTLGIDEAPALLAYKDVTSATNQRTMIASFIPFVGVLNSAPLLIAEGLPYRRQCCLLANLNSMAYDFIARQKVAGLHLNFFVVEQLPTLAPDAYDDPCPWDPARTLETWISDRVLKLSCTANDMKPLAEACGMKPPVHKWKPAERATLQAELDAAYFILYGVSREDMIFMLTTFQGTRARGGPSLFEPDPSKVLSEPGQRVVEAYDELQRNH